MAKRMGIMQEFILFLKENKAYWIAPIVIVLLLLAVLLVTVGGGAPFIYAIF